MGTYYIPRNYKGETRILYIFTMKSLLTSVVGAMIGSIFFLIFTLLQMQVVGIVIMVIFALIGFCVGAFKIPTIVAFPVTKKIGGESVGEIILRYIKYKKTKRIYLYTEEEDKE